MPRTETEERMGKGSKTEEKCKHINVPHVAPGWGCCKCNVYNGYQRATCKSCGHKPCYEPNEESTKVNAKVGMYEPFAAYKTIEIMSALRFEEFLKVNAQRLDPHIMRALDIFQEMNWSDVMLAMMSIVVGGSGGLGQIQKQLVAIILRKAADVIHPQS